MDALKAYLARFDPSIIGLRGTADEMLTTFNAFHVATIKQEADTGKTDYTVAHSDIIYVLDRAGRWRDFFNSNSNVVDITSDVRYLIDEGQ